MKFYPSSNPLVVFLAVALSLPIALAQPSSSPNKKDGFCIALINQELSLLGYGTFDAPTSDKVALPDGGYRFYDAKRELSLKSKGSRHAYLGAPSISISKQSNGIQTLTVKQGSLSGSPEIKGIEINSNCEITQIIYGNAWEAELFRINEPFCRVRNDWPNTEKQAEIRKTTGGSMASYALIGAITQMCNEYHRSFEHKGLPALTGSWPDGTEPATAPPGK